VCNSYTKRKNVEEEGKARASKRRRRYENNNKKEQESEQQSTLHGIYGCEACTFLYLTSAC